MICGVRKEGSGMWAGDSFLKNLFEDRKPTKTLLTSADLVHPTKCCPASYSGVLTNSEDAYDDDFEPEEVESNVIRAAADWRERLLQDQRARLKEESDKILEREREEKEFYGKMEVIDGEKQDYEGWVLVTNVEEIPQVGGK